MSQTKKNSNINTFLLYGTSLVHSVILRRQILCYRRVSSTRESGKLGMHTEVIIENTGVLNMLPKVILHAVKTEDIIPSKQTEQTR